MKLLLLTTLALSVSVQTIAAPNNNQLNQKIKKLENRVSVLEKALSDMQRLSTEYVFAGFTQENVGPLLDDAFTACRSEFGPDASVSDTREVLAALRNGTFLAEEDSYVFSSEVQYDAGVARDKNLLEVLQGQFVVVGIGGKTSDKLIEEAPVACSKPL